MEKTSQENKKYLWWIAVVFLLLSLSFVFDFWGEKREIIKHAPVGPEHFTKAPVREAKLEPVLLQDGFMYRCNDCHKIIEPSTVQKSYFSAHPDIKLDHGANNYCLTCHNVQNREMLTDINKNEVSFAQSHKTCLQCHGPIYRDWEKGIHGRINGYWDSSRGEAGKLTCVACHDPHQPKFKKMRPAPAPQIENYRKFLNRLTGKDSSHGG